MEVTEEVTAFRLRWLEALESGKYPQASHKLRTPLGFCCLGVACDISGLGEWVDPQPEAVAYEFHATLGGVGISLMPIAVERALGMNNEQLSMAMSMNDGGARFADIASRFRQLWNLPRAGQAATAETPAG